MLQNGAATARRNATGQRAYICGQDGRSAFIISHLSLMPVTRLGIDDYGEHRAPNRFIHD